MEAVQKVSFKHLPQVPKQLAKPWVAVEAFAPIDQRIYAKRYGDYEEEKKLTVLLKRQIKMDKTAWLKS